MSCYSVRHNLAFIHVPKNAGTAIRHVLRQVCDDLKDFDDIDAKHRKFRDPALANHLPVWKIEQLLGETNSDIPFEGMTKFMVVRNPWERMVSLYRHRLRKLHLSYEGKPRNTPEDIRVAETGFVPWLLTTPNAGDKVLTRMAQCEWGADLVFQQERLREDWGAFCGARCLAGVDDFNYAPIPHMNVNKAPLTDYRDYYDAEAKRHVEKYFDEDIGRFGYAF